MSNAFWLSGAGMLQPPQIPGGNVPHILFRYLPLVITIGSRSMRIWGICYRRCYRYFIVDCGGLNHFNFILPSFGCFVTIGSQLCSL